MGIVVAIIIMFCTLAWDGKRAICGTTSASMLGNGSSPWASRVFAGTSAGDEDAL